MTEYGFTSFAPVKGKRITLFANDSNHSKATRFSYSINGTGHPNQYFKTARNAELAAIKQARKRKR